MVEVFYAVGFLLPHSSVTLHLVPVSAPPRILLLEDLAVAISSLAQFKELAKCAFARKDLQKLADQFLEFEFREGVPSRHVRIALLSILTDHWVQTREEEEGTDSKNFNMDDLNARELLTVLSEEISCLSTDLDDGMSTPKVILNYLDVCVAAVENIALIACDWCRRHGTNGERRGTLNQEIDEESAYIINTAMAALEGRNLRENDVLNDDINGQNNQHHYPNLPVCAEAAQRIESVRMSNTTDSALYSQLVTSAAQDYMRRVNVPEDGEPEVFAQLDLSPFIFPDEPNDSPLVASDAHLHAYFVHYCRQIIGSRTDLSILSSTLALANEPIQSSQDKKQVMVVRSKNWLRLTAPPLPLHRLPEAGLPLGSRVGWTGGLTTLSGSSDPVNFVLAYAVRRCPRYDCEPEFKLIVTMRMYNMTAVTIARGVRMDLRVTQQKSAFAVEGEEETESNVLTSATTVYKHEIKAGDHVTWEVSVDDWPMKGTIELHSSVTFREIESEQPSTKVIGPTVVPAVENLKKPPPQSSSSSSMSDEESKSDDEATDAEGETVEDRTLIEDEDEVDLTLTGEPVRLSPVIGLQPCPLVFFRDGHGDENTFRFLWYQMPHRMPEMILFPAIPGVKVGSNTDDFAAGIAGIATIPLDEYIDELGVATTGWAFMTLGGDRLMCLMVESDTDMEGEQERTSTLHFRADDEALLLSIMGSDAARNSVVGSLTRGLWTCDNQVNSLFGM